MKLTPGTWQSTITGKKFIVGIVQFEFSDIERAKAIVNKKISHVDIHSPAGVKRSRDVIYSRLLAGKLADHAVEFLLKSCIAKNSLNYKIQEYDSVRNDNFLHPDPYDILIIGQSLSYELEVRSSFCYLIKEEKLLIDKLSIYGFYTSRTKSFEPPKDYYWQVVFYNKPKDLVQTEDFSAATIFEDDIINGCLEAYIVGGGPRSMFQSDKAVIRSDQDGAYYHSIFPISNGYDCAELLNQIFKL